MLNSFMASSFSPALLASLLLLISHYVTSFPHSSFNGLQDNDLYTETSLTFDKEALGWEVYGLNGSNTTSLCGAMPILGGRGVLGLNGYFQKKYSQLPAHDMIYFRVGFYIIDNWQEDDTVEVEVDGKSLSIGKTTGILNEMGVNICAIQNVNTQNLYVVYFVGKMNHTGSTAVLKIISNISDPTVASFGVRKVNIFFGNKTDANEKDAACNVEKMFVMDKICSCVTGNYLDSTSFSCVACHSSCADCFGPLASQCYACKTGYSFINNECRKCAGDCLDCKDTTENSCLRCPNTSWYRWDTSCPTTCDAGSYNQEILSNMKLCKPPCTTEQYYISNGTCYMNCPAPLNRYTNYFGRFCDLACPAGYYFFPNSTCLPNCPSPLVQSYLEDVLLKCDFPCKSGQYLFPNITCQNSCKSPLVKSVENEVDRCSFPCPSGQYLYNNGSCIATCDLPLIVTVENEVEKCVSPCNSPTPFYYVPEDNCRAQCASPLVQEEQPNVIKICKSPCTTTQYYLSNTTCSPNCPAPLNKYTRDSVKFCDLACPNGQYYYANASCYSTCKSPMVSSYLEDVLLKCNKPCPTNQYLYPNNSCIDSCPSPLTAIVDNEVERCISPCNNPTPYYYEPEKNCKAACDTPLIIERKFDLVDVCKSPCKLTEYYLSNTSCSANCPSPLNQYTKDSVKFCDLVCPNGSYYYPNTSCIGVCNYPLVKSYLEQVLLKCDFPCSNGQYLYKNGSCIRTCDLPLVPIIENEVNMCVSPCNETHPYYYVPEANCRASCDSPLLQEEQPNVIKICKSPCKATEFYLSNTTCSSNCPAILNQHVQDSVKFCDLACPTGQFYYPNTTCLPTCKPPLVTSYLEQVVLKCDFPCPDGQYLYPNGSCIGSCTTPLLIVEVNEVKTCISPCNISHPYYYMPESKCRASCSSPLIIEPHGGLVELCKSPCNPSEYYLSNTSCIGTCPSPLTQSTVDSVKFCNLACPAGQYLFPNGSCHSTCKIPLLTTYPDNVFLKCDFPCPDGQYLYPNSSCTTSCLSPLIKSVENEVNTCISPCSTPKPYFYIPELNCRGTCDLPLVFEQPFDFLKLCKSPCKTEEYYLSNSSCIPTCPTPLAKYTQDSVKFCNLACPAEQYLFPNGSCQSTCKSPLLTTYPDSVFLKCDFPCPIGQYLYPNGSCIASCDLPLSKTVENEVNKCVSPCNDPSPYYYVPEGNCRTTCNSPLIFEQPMDILKLCKSPCKATEFYLSNTTCSPNCPAILNQYVQDSVKFCDLACPTGQFYYPNTTCLPTCKSPLVTSYLEQVVLKCDFPCPDGQYLYPNGSCFGSCTTPLLVVEVNEVKTCISPCNTSHPYYYMPENKCRASCSSPLIIEPHGGLVELCKSPCNPSEYYLSNTSCIGTCPSPLTQSTVDSVKFCNLACAAGQYLFPNGSCHSTCMSPLVSTYPDNVFLKCTSPCNDTHPYFYEPEGNCRASCQTPLISQPFDIVQICKSPCKATEYYLSNTSCSTNCPALFNQYTKDSVKFCDLACPNGQYLFPNSSCLLNCNTPLIPSFVEQIYLKCEFPCPTSQYLYPNGSCISTCDLPLKITVENDVNKCISPCNNSNPYYFVPEATCRASCDSPLVFEQPMDILKLCKSPCKPEEYYLSNTSCIATCPTPLAKYTQDSVKFCNLACPVNQYLFPNGSCHSTCNSPLVTTYPDNVFLKCDFPCPNGQYLYPNGSCIASCDLPLSKIVENEVNKCVSPCINSSPYYYIPEGNCRTTCNSPLIFEQPMDILKLCKSPCKATEFYLSNTTCSPNCPAILNQYVQDSVKFCDLACPTGQFYYPNTTCLPTCKSPLVTNYLEQVVLKCDFPCPDGQYLYPNGSCIGSCTTPLLIVEVNEVKTCISPCNISHPYYYMPENKCRASCSSPLIIEPHGGLVELCKSPCNPSEYYLSNTSCIPTCPSPLSQHTIDSVKFCNLACPAGQYLFPNGSCHSTCKTPLLSTYPDNVFLKCDFPCPDGQYLYPDGSCTTSCLPPLIKALQNDVNTCVSPCTDPAPYFYVPQGNCRSSCDLPLVSDQPFTFLKLCKSPCKPSEYYLSNSSCITTCPSPLNNYARDSIKYCDLTCPPNQHLYPNGSCLSSCNRPMISTYLENIFLKCDYPCPDGQHLYINGSCSALCPLPLITRLEDGVSRCKSPCSGPTPYYYEPERTCISSCDTPLVLQPSDTINLCKSPCQSTDYYLSNSSCVPTCPTPLNQYTNNSIKFCDLACPSEQYLSPNNTCQSSCNFPLLPSYPGNIFLKCDYPCADGQYLYPNKTCMPSCTVPWVIIVESGVNRCASPCNESYPYYFEPNGTCRSSCTPPFVVKEEDVLKLCTAASVLPVTTEDTSQSMTIEELIQIRGMTSSVSASSNMLGATTVLSMVFGAANPAASTMSGFVKMMPYIRYINIDYPPRLQFMLDNLNSTVISFSFGFALPESLEDQFTMRTLPVTSKFEKYEFHSSFFINYWSTLSSLIILLGVLLILAIFICLTRNCPRIHSILEGLRPIIQWNFILMVFCGNFDSIIIPTSLEFRTVEFDSFASIFSFVLCIILNLAAISCFCTAFYVIKDIRKSKLPLTSTNAVAPVVPPEIKWRHYQLYFKGSKDDSVIRHMFIIPYLARLYLFNFVIANMYEHPLTQGILIVLLSVFILSSMLWLRPFISPVVFCQHVSDEIIMLIVNICMMTLAILDNLEIYNETSRNNLGEVIIYSNLVFNITANIYLVVYLAVGFKAAYQNMRKNKKTGLISCIIAFLAPYEAGGMDMEATPAKVGPQSPHPTPRVPDPARQSLLLADPDKGSNAAGEKLETERFLLKTDRRLSSVPPFIPSENGPMSPDIAISPLLSPGDRITEQVAENEESPVHNGKAAENQPAQSLGPELEEEHNNSQLIFSKSPSSMALLSKKSVSPKRNLKTAPGHEREALTFRPIDLNDSPADSESIMCKTPSSQGAESPVKNLHSIFQRDRSPMTPISPMMKLDFTPGGAARVHSKATSIGALLSNGNNKGDTIRNLSSVLAKEKISFSPSTNSIKWQHSETDLSPLKSNAKEKKTIPSIQSIQLESNNESQRDSPRGSIRPSVRGENGLVVSHTPSSGRISQQQDKSSVKRNQSFDVAPNEEMVVKDKETSF